MDVPPELKGVTKFLRQAKKMDKIQPLVAYHCRLHAMETAMKVQQKSPEVSKFLITLMDELEHVNFSLSLSPSHTQNANVLVNIG